MNVNLFFLHTELQYRNNSERGRTSQKKQILKTIFCTGQRRIMMRLHSEIMDPAANDALCSRWKEAEMVGAPDCREAQHFWFVIQLLHILLQGKCVKSRRRNMLSIFFPSLFSWRFYCIYISNTFDFISVWQQDTLLNGTSLSRCVFLVHAKRVLVGFTFILYSIQMWVNRQPSFYLI